MVHIESVLKYTLDTYEGEARTRKIALSSTIGQDIPALRANPIRIRQLLDNLVGNAIKYTNEGGQVNVSINVQDGQIILEIKDTGPGIPKSEQTKIFDKFYRATNVPDGSQGTGLGLAIVKSIVESQHGRIWVESTLGEGSLFFVVLPLHEQIP